MRTISLRSGGRRSLRNQHVLAWREALDTEGLDLQPQEELRLMQPSLDWCLRGREDPHRRAWRGAYPSLRPGMAQTMRSAIGRRGASFMKQGDIMIRFVRTATVAQGKLGDALAFAREITEYIGKAHGQKLEVLMPVGGNPLRIAWKTDYASLGALEDMMAKLLADPKYLELSAKGGVNFVAGSVNDSIWRTL